jgi:hypothetical protein
VKGVVKAFALGTFPRLDFPRMNQLLAEYRHGTVDAEDAARRQREIVSSLEATSDPFYVENALAVYLTLTGAYPESIEIFDRLEDELNSSRADPEPSMVYLISANRASTRFLAGDRTRARAEWSSLAELADRIAYVFRPMMMRKHELLGETMAELGEEEVSPREFDEYLIANRKTEFGPLWKTFGRAFRMPEVEFWREN